MEVLVFGSGGSGGIPVPGCNCRTCKTFKERGIELKRAAYVVKWGKKEKNSLWLDLSPDLRSQLLSYGSLPDAFFTSHLHYDHFSGISELRQIFYISRRNTTQPYVSSTLFIPEHMYKAIHSLSLMLKALEESPYHDFLEMEEKGLLDVVVLKKQESYTFKGLKLLQVENVHAGGLSSSLYMEFEGKKLLYLSDVEELSPEIYDIIEGGIDLIIAHTPFLKTSHELEGEGHLSIADLEGLKAKKILLSHFSHKLGMSPEEIKKFSKGKFLVAFDGLVVKV